MFYLINKVDMNKYLSVLLLIILVFIGCKVFKKMALRLKIMIHLMVIKCQCFNRNTANIRKMGIQ